MDTVYEASQENPASTTVEGHKRGDRHWQAEIIQAYHNWRDSGGPSLLQFSKEQGVPESTIRYTLSAHAESCGEPAIVIQLAETPEGLALIQRIILAAIFVITQVLGGGYRIVSLFLELSGLSHVAAAGYGTQYMAVKAMEEAIVDFGQDEESRLSALMVPKSISLVQDETYNDHKGRPCLVALDPGSDYIFVEEYAPDRSAETWKKVLEERTQGIQVNIFQSASDEASALLKCTRDAPDRSHSPDLFHVEQEVGWATSLPLDRQVKAATEGVQEAQKCLEGLVEEAREYEEQRQGPGRPRDYQGRVDQAREEVEQAKVREKEARERKAQVRAAVRAISAAYHPFDLKSGALRDGPQVQADIEKQFGMIEQAAKEASLSTKCFQRLAKALRVVPAMIATIFLIHTLIRAKVAALLLPEPVEKEVLERLIPGRYLELAARKAATAAERAEIGRCAWRLQASCYRADGPLTKLEAEKLSTVEDVALECAELFQRSTAGVEGRNGFLDLYQHRLHRLVPRKLAAMTVIHNYFTTRADGTTAAGRLFGRRPRDLFTYLLQRLPPPAWPAASRPPLPLN